MIIENRCLNCSSPIIKDIDACKHCVDRVVKLGDKRAKVKDLNQTGGITNGNTSRT